MFLFICYFTPISIFHQEVDNNVSFTVKFDLENETKGYGYHLDNYFVNIDRREALKLNGEKIKISGKYQIIKGLSSKPKKYNNKGEQIFEQARQNDIKYISSPKIEIIK